MSVFLSPCTNKRGRTHRASLSTAQHFARRDSHPVPCTRVTRASCLIEPVSELDPHARKEWEAVVKASTSGYMNGANKLDAIIHECRRACLPYGLPFFACIRANTLTICTTRQRTHPPPHTHPHPHTHPCPHPLTRTARLSVLHPAMLHSLFTSGEPAATLTGPTTIYRGGPTRR